MGSAHGPLATGRFSFQGTTGCHRLYPRFPHNHRDPTLSPHLISFPSHPVFHERAVVVGHRRPTRQRVACASRAVGHTVLALVVAQNIWAMSSTMAMMKKWWATAGQPVVLASCVVFLLKADPGPKRPVRGPDRRSRPQGTAITTARAQTDHDKAPPQQRRKLRDGIARCA